MEPPAAAKDRTDESAQPRLVDRFKIVLVSALGYWIIRAICSTLRWQIENWKDFESIHAAGKRIIVAFWHGRMFMAAYYFRHLGFVVMTSRNRDGEYIGRVLQRFGYGVARGSSTRGSRGAIVEMLRALKRDGDVAFALDGPRGPRYLAKPGAAYLAWKTGNAVMPLNISAQKKWVLRSWDHFQIPKPFSRALVNIGTPIYIHAEATEDDLRRAEEQIQRSLDDLRFRGDSCWGDEPDR